MRSRRHSSAAHDLATLGFGVLNFANSDRDADIDKSILAGLFNGFLAPDCWLPCEHGLRHRAYQCFAVRAGSMDLDFIPAPAHYLQSPEVNPVAGGISRAFRVVPEEHPATRVARRLATAFLQLIDESLDSAGRDAECLMDVHYIRVIGPGNPCPEGIHCDGLIAGATHLVELRNAQGGMTHLYNRHRESIGSYKLTGFLDTVVFDDRRVLHYTTPIRPREPGTSHRDVVLLGLREQQPSV